MTTGSAVCLEEGERTQGVWLPLALSDVVMWLMVVVRMVGGREVCRKVKIPNRSDKLREWCLPMMAEAMAADEKRFEDERRRQNRETLGDSIMELAKRMGAEVVDE